jgi:AraC-like DNA-binding protein
MSGWTAHIRSYGVETPQERHDFVQLVLPLFGKIELQIEGSGAVIGNNLAAAVSAQALHTQQAKHSQQALILNVESSLATDCGFATLEERKYFKQSVQAQQMTRLLARAASSQDNLCALAPNLIAHCAMGIDHPSMAFLAIEELVDLAPLNGLTIAEMAQASGLKESQFHALFRSHFGKAPHQWLIHKKLDAVKLALETTDIELCELAQQSGYSDQSALTRAFRHRFGIPLSEYRLTSRH